MLPRLKDLVAVLLAGLLVTPACVAQENEWTGADGAMSLTLPDGWRRMDLLLRKLSNTIPPRQELMIDKGDSMVNAPGISCTLTMYKDPKPAGLTQPLLNKRMGDHQKDPAEASQWTDHRVRITDGVLFVESEKRQGNRDDVVMLRTYFLHQDSLYMPIMLCSPNILKKGISDSEAADAHAMFAAIRIKP